MVCKSEDSDLPARTHNQKLTLSYFKLSVDIGDLVELESYLEESNAVEEWDLRSTSV